MGLILLFYLLFIYLSSILMISNFIFFIIFLHKILVVYEWKGVVTLEDNLSTWHIRICKRGYDNIFFGEWKEKGKWQRFFVCLYIYMRKESGRWIEGLEFFFFIIMEWKGGRILKGKWDQLGCICMEGRDSISSKE